MKKQVSFSGRGQRADIGSTTIFRILPNRYADAVGPFVFLDHIAPQDYKSLEKDSVGAHPHRGIATLSYILSGEDEHVDSAGNHARVSSGGIQWMKAGSGIIHDENLTNDPSKGNQLIHGFQFWINLPSHIKKEKPEYLAIQSSDVPQKALPEDRGWIKVIAGSYEELRSVIPDYTEQFLYHIHLEAGKEFSVSVDDKIEVAIYLPTQNIEINDAEYDAGDIVEFDSKAGTIELSNNSGMATDILLFGGEKYVEPIVAKGPFVMNSEFEIAQAYRDFLAGKYGKLSVSLEK
jgi:redox-sensitive bicupin YhaK (pirin superfamily)